MTLRTDLTDDDAQDNVHAAQHNEANQAIIDLQNNPYAPVPDSYLLLHLLAAIDPITGFTACTWGETASAGSDIELLEDTQTVQFDTAGRYSWYMEIDVGTGICAGNLGLSVANQQSNPIMDPINDSFDQTFDYPTAAQVGTIPWAFPEVAFAAGDQLQWSAAGGRVDAGSPTIKANVTFLLIRRVA